MQMRQSNVTDDYITACAGNNGPVARASFNATLNQPSVLTQRFRLQRTRAVTANHRRSVMALPLSASFRFLLTPTGRTAPS